MAAKQSPAAASKKIGWRDFVDPNKPWLLQDNNGSFLGYFDFVPIAYRRGPWNPVVTLTLIGVVGSLLYGAVWIHKSARNEGWISQFDIPAEAYTAFNRDWYLQLFMFAWMLFVCHNVMWKSPIGTAAWITYTLWSWTMVTVRVGLCVMAPFFPWVRLLAEMLRFPALQSASLSLIHI